MKPSLQIVGRDEAESLPVLATATDVREVIRFLKHHPADALDKTLAAISRCEAGVIVI